MPKRVAWSNGRSGWFGARPGGRSRLKRRRKATVPAQLAPDPYQGVMLKHATDAVGGWHEMGDGAWRRWTGAG